MSTVCMQLSLIIPNMCMHYVHCTQLIVDNLEYTDKCDSYCNLRYWDHSTFVCHCISYMLFPKHSAPVFHYIDQTSSIAWLKFLGDQDPIFVTFNGMYQFVLWHLSAQKAAKNLISLPSSHDSIIRYPHPPPAPNA